MLNVEHGLISHMKIFRWTKSIRNILERLKLNVGIFKGLIYIFNPNSFKQILIFVHALMQILIVIDFLTSNSYI